MQALSGQPDTCWNNICVCLLFVLLLCRIIHPCHERERGGLYCCHLIVCVSCVLVSVFLCHVFLCLEHLAHYKAKNQSPVETNFCMSTYAPPPPPHAHTHTHTHTHTYTYAHTHTHTHSQYLHVTCFPFINILLILLLIG